MKFRLVNVFVGCALLATMACSEPAKNTAKTDAAVDANKEPPGPPKPVSAKTAFWEVYTPARKWATDLMPIGMSSDEVEGMPAENGLAPRWTVAFVSPSRHELRTYYYSVVSKPPLVWKGVKADSAMPWAGPAADAMPFQTAEFSIDSDTAFKTASEKAAAWLKKHPDKTPSMKIGNATRYPAPMWYLLWGDKKDGYVAYVNASTGAFGAK